MYAVESVYTVKFNLNPKSKQWATGDSGKFEHTDCLDTFHVSVGVHVFEVLLYYTFIIEYVYYNL